MYRIILYSCLALFTRLTIFSQESIPAGNEAFRFEASYVGDNINNLSGGIKTGSCYLGMANIRLSFNTGNAGLWKGGEFYINSANTHGASPSGEFIGDLQVVSNIEAGNHTYIQELWYKQLIGHLELTAGLQDLNVEFVNSEYSSLYLNSSFGILPTISGNIPAPIFPLTSLGLSVKWQVSEKATWLTALYDGCPTDFEDNPYNLSWKFNSDDGTLAISEFQFSTTFNNMPGTYKAGIYTHYHFLKVSDESDEPDSLCETNYGFYVIADQMLWRKPEDKGGLGLFVQFGFAPEKFNFNHYYTGAGLNFYGLLKNTGDDILGLAIAHAGIAEVTGSETTLELTYQLPLTKNIFIQPDFQYVINPAGVGEKLENSFAATFRFGLSF